MNNLPELIQKYLRYCEGQRRLDSKTLKAYRIDLEQYCACFVDANISDITIPDIENYVTEMHDIYKPKTVKRKIAAIKAWYHYLEFQDLIPVNPFNKTRIHFRTPQTLHSPYEDLRRPALPNAFCLPAYPYSPFLSPHLTLFLSIFLYLS